MVSKNRSQNIKATAAELLVSLDSESLSIPMSRLVLQGASLKIHRLFIRMTVGGFLKVVCGMGSNLNTPYCDTVDALSSIFNSEGTKPANQSNSTNNASATAHSIALLGNGDAPLFQRIIDAINGAIYYMKSSGSKGCQRQANVIDHYCNNSGCYEVTAKEFGCTRQNVEQAVKRFNQLLLEGKAWSGLDKLYAIDSKLLKDIHKVANTLTGCLLCDLPKVIGSIEDKQLDYILRMLDCEVATIGDAQFVIEKGQYQVYSKIMNNARNALSKSVTSIPFSKLSEGLSSNHGAFLRRYLSKTEGVKILEDCHIMMTGKGLDKAVRQARIVYEANGWISKEEIATRYETEYEEPMGALANTALHKLGCTNHNKLGYWLYGTEKVGKVKDVILTILTAEKPVATFSTILKAIRANGLNYPEDTIRTYITDIACPENRNHDLFCLKGYTHLFPSLSWRSYKKQPA